MGMVSECLGKLEGFTDLDEDILSSTNARKLLKKILKLDKIPMDAEFRIKARSKCLLNRWEDCKESSAIRNTIFDSSDEDNLLDDSITDEEFMFIEALFLKESK